MRKRAGIVGLGLALVLVLVGCGGDDGGGDADRGGDGGGDAAAELPAECPDGPVRVAIEGGELLPGIDGPEFAATSQLVTVNPIVLEEVPEGDIDAAREAAEATDLLSYSIYLADYELDEDSLGLLGLSSPPEGGTHLAFTVVPPTEEPLATGDVVEAGTPEFESTTTFATMGLLYETGDTAGDSVFLGSDTEGSGEAEILYVDDEQLCLRFTQEGTIFGGDAEGTWSVDTVVAGPIGPRTEFGLS